MLLISVLWSRRRRRRRIHRRILREFNRALLLIQDRTALESTLSARVRELLPVRSLVLFHLRPESDRLLPGYSLGVDRKALPTNGIDLRGRLARWLLVNETHLLLRVSPAVLDHVDPEERDLLTRLEIDVCVPLITQGSLVGLLLLALEEPGRVPGKEEQEILELLAQQGALALENAHLYEQQRLRLQRLHRAERLAAVGQLAAGAAHEIRNPLTAIRSTMQYLGQSLPEEGQQEMVDELLSEVDRINKTLNDLLQLTREESFEPVLLDAVEALSQAVSLIEAQADSQGVEVETVLPDHELRIRGDPDRLRQLLLNLLLNALQAMPSGGRLTVRIGTRDRPEGPSDNWVQIGITDTGSGIEPDAIERVFDPFYTTKSDGTGLGLAISYRIAERHQGELQIDSEPGRGTTVFIRLPGVPWPES